VDLDTDSYLAEEELSGEATGFQEIPEKEYIKTDLVFISGKNTQETALNGRLRYAVKPDGTKEFGLLVLLDPSANKYYTLFLNPYFSSVEILEGAFDFDEQYPM